MQERVLVDILILVLKLLIFKNDNYYKLQVSIFIYFEYQFEKSEKGLNPKAAACMES